MDSDERDKIYASMDAAVKAGHDEHMKWMVKQYTRAEFLLASVPFIPNVFTSIVFFSIFFT